MRVHFEETVRVDLQIDADNNKAEGSRTVNLTMEVQVTEFGQDHPVGTVTVDNPATLIVMDDDSRSTHVAQTYTCMLRYSLLFISGVCVGFKNHQYSGFVDEPIGVAVVMDNCDDCAEMVLTLLEEGSMWRVGVAWAWLHDWEALVTLVEMDSQVCGCGRGCGHRQQYACVSGGIRTASICEISSVTYRMCHQYYKFSIRLANL